MILFCVLVWLLIGLITVLYIRLVYDPNPAPVLFILLGILMGPVTLMVCLISVLDDWEL